MPLTSSLTLRVSVNCAILTRSWLIFCDRHPKWALATAPLGEARSQDFERRHPWRFEQLLGELHRRLFAHAEERAA